MLETTMYVKCTHCGYDNSPEYRFCGMCGASLARPPAASPEPAKEAPRAASGNGEKAENVHGPSFLGLSEDPKVEFHYLYEDEPPRSYAGLIFFVLILLGAGGYLGWQYHNHGFPFNRMNASNSSGNQTSASPSEVAPAQTDDQQSHINKPMTGAGDVLPTQPDQNAQNQPPAPNPNSAQNPSATKPTESDIPPANGAAQNQPAPENANQSAAPAQNPAAENKPAPPPATTEEARATPPPGVSEATKVTKEPAKPRTPKPAPSRATPAAAASPDAELELTGERYLYGNGVPQNCTRAESSLRTAALHGNSKAQTVLGTMYATGHCVGRDLPTAYRWFARALHQEPQNSRISDDLQVLWRQMTPQEKQLAMANH
jgi:hypothetical protein